MELTHFNEKGRAHMVDVGHKEVTKRRAIASGKIIMSSETLNRIKEGLISKGDVLGVAQIAGIMGSKKTSELIPMCHNIFISKADIDFRFIQNGIEVVSTLETESQTGIEMEALTAVSIACLTIYDMCKAMDRTMEIKDIMLLEKTGGKSGVFRRDKMGKVVSINISREKGVMKDPIGSGFFKEDFGLEEDAHSGKWIRQVSLLDMSSFKKMEDKGADGLRPGVFAENITTEGMILYELPIGTRLRIGETIHEVTKIGKECHDGCEIAKKVGKCIMPLEGIFTRVIKEGIIKEGDLIQIID